MNSQAQKVAWIFSGIFLVSFAIALFPNPLVGEHSIFKTNFLHDLVHLLTAVGFLVVANISGKASVIFMKSFGVVYLGVALLGFMMLGSDTEGHLLGLIHINMEDNFLHLGLAAIIILTGYILAKKNSH